MSTGFSKLIHAPSFFDPAKAYQYYSPDISAAFHEGIEYGRSKKLKPAEALLSSGKAHAFVWTDLQRDFRDHGRLPVKGTDDVVLRTCLRLLNGIVEDYYGGIIFSLDGHGSFHVSFEVNYRDEHGHSLNLSDHGGAAMLTLVDEEKAKFKATAFGPNGPYEVGYYMPHFNPMDVVAYWKHLQATGQGDIWVFVPHCIIGTDGTNLHPLLEESLAFACGARSIQPTIIHKGHLSNTDWFGPLEPCRPDRNYSHKEVQEKVINEMKRYATVEFAGVAEDFCEYAMRCQTMNCLEGTEYLSRLRFISDCTAPIIPNAPHVLSLYEKARKVGIEFITHDTPFAA